MSSVSLKFNGLKELMAALRDLPDDLVSEADSIVSAAGHGAMSQVAADYPVSGGKKKGMRLRASLRLKATRSRFGTDVRVRSMAPHAIIFERGTVKRTTGKGWNRGSMPKGRVFVPAMQFSRTRMFASLRDMLKFHGFKVTGSER